LAENLAVYIGEDPLTEREIEVLRRIAEGDRNRDIGEHLGIAEDTVKVHVKRIMDKLGAKDRTQAVAIGIRRGVITL
jgi:DNA-binding NarL/FixJ family response regulator